MISTKRQRGKEDFEVTHTTLHIVDLLGCNCVKEVFNGNSCKLSL